MAKYNLRAIHVKILLTTLIFCAFSGFYETVTPTLPLFLYDLGYTALEIGFITSILSIIIFILDSALFFVILYLICRRSFMEGIASVAISLVIGTVGGYWIGGLLGLLLPSRFPQSPSFFTLSILLSEFGACSAAYLNTKWEQLTPRTDRASQCPFGVVLIAALYTILSVLSAILTCALLSWLFSVGFEVLFKKILLAISLMTLLSILSVAYVVIAHGFYRGRRWAWFAVFASTLMSTLLSVNQLILMFNFDILFILRIIVLLLDTFILIYLIQSSIRIYFGIINPMSES